MKSTPENPTPPANPPSSRRELTPEERALLPDFDDEARIGSQETVRPSAATAPAAIAPAPKASGDVGVVLGGAVCGCFGNFALGFILLAFERAGLMIYGPGALVLVLGTIVLILLARAWPRRVIVGGAAFGISLLLSYGLLYLIARLVFNSLDPSKLPDDPPDGIGQSTLQAPQQVPPENQSNS